MKAKRKCELDGVCSLAGIYSPLLRKTTNDAVTISENVDNVHFNSEVKRIKTLLSSLLSGSMCRGSGGILCLLLFPVRAGWFFPEGDLCRPQD